jgi:hypothetical protein
VLPFPFKLISNLERNFDTVFVEWNWLKLSHICWQHFFCKKVDQVIYFQISTILIHFKGGELFPEKYESNVKGYVSKYISRIFFSNTLFAVNCEKRPKCQIWINIESVWTLFHMNGGVIGFFGQLWPTYMLFKHSVSNYLVTYIHVLCFVFISILQSICYEGTFI